MKDVLRWLTRVLPCLLLVTASVLLGARIGRILPDRLELPTLVVAILAVAAFYLTRETPVWNLILLSLLAVALGAYGALAGILDRGPWSWVILVVGVALAALVGFILRPRRGMRVVYSLAVTYILAWILVAAVIAPVVLIRSLAAIGWLLFVSVGSFVFARAASDGPSVDVSELLGDLLIVSANLMLTGATAFGL